MIKHTRLSFVEPPRHIVGGFLFAKKTLLYYYGCMRKLFIIFIVVVIVGIILSLGFFKTASFFPAEEPIKENNPVSIPKESAVIRMTPDGFSPAELKIRKGERVVFINEDTVNRWPASNLHPTHGIYPEFDPQDPVAPGESWSFTFTKSGVWFFHDHLRPLLRGKVDVE